MDTGIPKSTFSDWKNGRSKPKIEKLKILADYFGVSIEYYLRRRTSENIPGAKVEIEGRAAKLTDKNGDTLCIAYDSKTKSIVCLSTCNMDNP